VTSKALRKGVAVAGIVATLAVLTYTGLLGALYFNQ
jgi:hypothetical protein